MLDQKKQFKVQTRLQRPLLAGVSPSSSVSPGRQGTPFSLRPLTLDDVDDRYVGWLNDPEVAQYTSQANITHTLKSLTNFTKSQLDNPNVYFWAIVVDGVHIGNIKLFYNMAENRGDIGLIIGEKDFWGKGYGTEAVKLVTDYAFNTLKLPKVIAGSRPGNIGTQRIFEKNGYTVERYIGDAPIYSRHRVRPSNEESDQECK
ncbi:MAG: GNAT family N-acetyltransferase [Candidatus Thermoplasmatota archaeon]|nr:GNAT family N-acetyltransferase [Candidatus Thermoplasmatota archaeon]